jgi:hypothetical protein
MPQYPNNVLVSTQNDRTVPGVTGATIITTGAARLHTINVVVAGSAAGAAYDAATVPAGTAATQLISIPNALGSYPVNMQVTNGIVVTPGAGQTLAVSWRK